MNINWQWLKRNMWIAYISVLACWGVSSYCEIFSYLRKGTLFARVIDGRPYVTDFVAFYNGAMLAAECGRHPVNIYDPELQNAGIVKLIAPIKPELTFYLPYPPQFFALVEPMSGLELQNAWFIWCGLATVLSVVALLLLGKLLGGSTFARAFLIVAFFSSFPACVAFSLGQTALYLFPSVVGFYFLLKSKKYFLSGLLSAALLIKVQYAPYAISTGLIVGRIRYLLGLAISSSCLALLTVSKVGWSNIFEYPKIFNFAETSDKVCGVNAHSMQNIRGELTLLCGQDNSLVYFSAMGLFVIGFLAISWMWIWFFPRVIKIGVLNEDQSFDICFALTILSMLICSPHTYTQDFVCAAVPAVLLFRAFDLASAGSFMLRCLKLLLVAFPLLSWNVLSAKTFLALIFVQPYFLWTVAVFAIVIWELRKVYYSAQYKNNNR